MKPIKTLPLLLLLFCFCGIIGVVNADDGGETSSSTGRNDISMNHTERKTKRQHLIIFV